LATLPQQEPSTAASDALPQHGPAASGIADVVCGAFPQHPLVLATDKAVAGSPVKPPGGRSVSSMIVSFEDRDSTTVEFGGYRNRGLHADSMFVKLDPCRNHRRSPCSVRARPVPAAHR
jgi:hypothetical protein